MAHFAQLDENNVVIQVIVVANHEIQDENGNESEAKGIAFCKNLLGENTRWVQTSYNHNFRNTYAGKGHTYDPDRDVFIPPRPFPSFVFNSETLDWHCPIPMPEQREGYIGPMWDEDSVSWKFIINKDSFE
jgi:hypothetical protein